MLTNFEVTAGWEALRGLCSSETDKYLLKCSRWLAKMTLVNNSLGCPELWFGLPRCLKTRIKPNLEWGALEFLIHRCAYSYTPK
jgi:hypothetical protein